MATLFTSESVSAGHPDKVCDAISDAIVDACLRIDPKSRVAVETMVKGKSDKAVIILAGEVSLSGNPPSYEQIARKTAVNIGYNSHEIGMDATNPDLCEVQVHITTQSPNISQGVDGNSDDDIGAGDQGMMFGYACTETEAEDELRGRFFPLPAALAQRICRRLDMIVQTNEISWIRPDGKSQVTVEYDDSGNPSHVHTVVVAVQHDSLLKEQFDGSEVLEHQFVTDEIRKHVVEHAIPSHWLRHGYRLVVNGTGRFADPGGPYSDAGITGRKIIVDTYGGMGRHGGGAFSGKDPTKVDRSAAYYSRWAAKHVVAAGLATRCEIQVAYVIGVSQPVSLHVNSFATGIISDKEIEEKIRAVFDFRPSAIVRELKLRNPRYSITASGGHFGRPPSEDGDFEWERLDESRLSGLRLNQN
ncbi:TPA: methionine adenosyltransferase [Candidatus Thalassarchaeaceae archaeon]|nr:methionine adenosyltransferase [Euryarchaeota archaeon]MDG1547693.1 methionine adenosyltransferase [Candidatus Thalassarchaeaceae archaeon]MBT3846697.1 methionine adenosyltransferase [Euryarchaeota archaeon]MBT4156359.1 methionine adenosyltransferase [Euryarchaeota archaeon]MBT4180304.1 methionine adenosyltransferase [Euryarchaeota archaeon]